MNNSLTAQLEAFGNELIEAAVSDLSRPETIAAIKDRAIVLASALVGRNLNNAFTRPFIEAWIDQKIDAYRDTFMKHVGLALSDPPVSVDIAADVVKEEMGTKVDAFAEKLKARLAEKQSQKG